jgi:hypothetical protein
MPRRCGGKWDETPRFFLHLSAAVPAAFVAWPRGLKAAELPLPAGWRTFEIVTSVEVAAPSGHTQLWLPMPLKASSDYQRLLSTSWNAPGAVRAELVVIPGYDVQHSRELESEVAEGSRSRTYQEASDAPSRV